MKFSQKENFQILSNAPLRFIFEITQRIWSIGKTLRVPYYMKSLSMPLNIDHSLEHVSTPSASSEDYVLPPDLPREISLQSWTKYRGGGGALPYWKVR